MSKGDDVRNLLRKVRKPSVAVTSPVEDAEHVFVGLDGILGATEKLLAVNRGLVPPDERDSWQFKKVMTPDALLRERVKLDADKVRFNLIRRVARTKSLKPVSSFSFDPYTRGLLIGNPLSMPLEEINPMHLVEQSRRITQMGPGGLPSDDSITEEAQALHPSQFGFLSTLEGPESSRIGVDTRLAQGVKFGSDGNLYQRFFDRKKKRYTWLSPKDLDGRVLALPD